ncbi:MAG: autotransporter-associated beta strand repeat-containing protein [Prevotellaceae bacterium]|jgi:autotransporter-associated beta strand protein|nr:autotransporter-associated beta strand repeat-containing protein [Prevotellaceae bacterium]
MKKSTINAAKRLFAVLVCLTLWASNTNAVNWSGEQTLADGEIFATAITLTGDVTINIDGTATISSVISGAYNLTVASGNLIFTANNTYTGGTTINQGASLQLGDNGTTGIVSNTGLIVVNNGGTLIFNRSNNVTYAGVISGTGEVQKNGAGILIFTGENTFTGNITIEENYLYIGNNTTTGSIVGNINVNVGAAIRFNRTNDITYDGVISGTGNIQKYGTEKLTLNGNNTYTGNTAIQAGTLALGENGSIAESSSVALNAATAKFDISEVVTSATIKRLSSGYADAEVILGENELNIGTLSEADGGGTYAGKIIGNGSVRKRGTASLVFTGENTFIGNTTVEEGYLLVGNNTTTGSIAGNINIYTGANVRFNRTNDITYDGVISGAGNIQKYYTEKLTLNGNNTYTGNTDIAAGTLALGENGSIAESSNVALNGATAKFDISEVETSTTIKRLNGNNADAEVILGNNALIVGSEISSVDGGGIYAGKITGDGTVNKNGIETLILTGANTYTGNTTVNQGTLQIGNNTAAGNIAGNIILNNGTEIYFYRFNEMSYDGIISGAGNVRKNGGNKLIFNENQTYTGKTTISAGKLALVENASIAASDTIFLNASTAKLDISDVATSATIKRLSANNANAEIVLGEKEIFIGTNDLSSNIYLGKITGLGNVIKQGTDTLILSGANTYTGNTTINSGVLQIGNNATAGTILSDILVNNNGKLIFNRSNNITYANVISGAGEVQKVGAGVLVLTGENTFTGNTNIEQGTLQIGSNGVIGSYAGDIINNGIETYFYRTDTIVYNGIISGTGNVRKVGNGRLTFNRNQTYTGKTTIAAGTLALDINGSIAESDTVFINANAAKFNISEVENSATIKRLYSTFANAEINLGEKQLFIGTDEFSTDGGGTYAGKFTGEGSVNKQGADTLILTGASTLFTGSTWLNSGVTRFKAANNFGTGTIFNNGGTLQWAEAAAIDISPRLSQIDGTLDLQENDVIFASPFVPSETSNFAKKGAGTLILTANFTNVNAEVLQGNLQIGDNTPTGSIGGDIILNDDTKLICKRNNSLIYDGVISGNGAVEQAGNVLILTKNNTYTGGTTVSNGRLQLGNNSTEGNIAGDIEVALPSYIIFSRSDDFDFEGIISGEGGAIKTGAGTLTLSGENTATGVFFNDKGRTKLSKWNGIFYQDAGNLEAIGDVTIGGALILAGGKIMMDLTTAAPSKITAAGVAEISGTIALDVTASGSVANQTLIKAASGINSVSHFALNTHNFSSSSLFATGTELKLTATSTGINDIFANGNLSIFPNPAQDELRIANYELREGEMVTIADLQGRIVLTANATTINVSHLPQGVYLVRVGNAVAKFVKK